MLALFLQLNPCNGKTRQYETSGDTGDQPLILWNLCFVCLSFCCWGWNPRSKTYEAHDVSFLSLSILLSVIMIEETQIEASILIGWGRNEMGLGRQYQPDA